MSSSVRPTWDSASALEKAAIEYVRAREAYYLQYSRTEERKALDAAWQTLLAAVAASDNAQMIEETP